VSIDWPVVESIEVTNAILLRIEHFLIQIRDELREQHSGPD